MEQSTGLYLIVTVAAHIQTSSQDCTFLLELQLSSSAASDNTLYLSCLCCTFVLLLFKNFCYVFMQSSDIMPP